MKLEDAAEDLESGAQFYESCTTGVGDHFLDSSNPLAGAQIFVQINGFFQVFKQMDPPFRLKILWITHDLTPAMNGHGVLYIIA